MKIYLAGPMSGYPELNAPAFATIAEQLRKSGHFVFNPVESNPEDGNYRTCMAVDLAWICAHAEAVMMLPGWDRSKGATVEHALAQCLGLQVIYLLSDTGLGETKL